MVRDRDRVLRWAEILRAAERMGPERLEQGEDAESGRGPRSPGSATWDTESGCMMVDLFLLAISPRLSCAMRERGCVRRPPLGHAAFALFLGIATVAGRARADLGGELERATEMVRSERVEEAVEVIEAALDHAGRREPGRGQALLWLAGLTSDAQRARKLYEEVAEQWPGEAFRAELELARYHFSVGEYVSARQRLLGMRDRHGGDPGLPEVHHLLGSCELALGQSGLAADAFSMAVSGGDRTPVAAWSQLGLGQALEEAGLVEEATKAFSEAVSRAERDHVGDLLPVALMALAGARHEAGDDAGAEELMGRVVAGGSALAPEARFALARYRLTSAAIAVSEAREEEEAPVPLGRWAIQVGAFSEVGKATDLRARLRERGHNIEVVTRDVGGRPFYRVLLGHYPDRASAYAAGLEFDVAEGLDFLPVERE